MGQIRIDYSDAANELLNELGRTGVLSQDFKDRIIRLLLKSLEDAVKYGQGEKEKYRTRQFRIS